MLSGEGVADASVIEQRGQVAAPPEKQGSRFERRVSTLEEDTIKELVDPDALKKLAVDDKSWF